LPNSGLRLKPAGQARIPSQRPCATRCWASI